METISCLSLLIAPIIVGVILLIIEYKTGWFADKTEHYQEKIKQIQKNVSVFKADIINALESNQQAAPRILSGR